MIEQIENILISNLLYYHLVDQEEIDIYKFGLECCLLKTVHYITYCLIALVCDCFWEFLIFIISYIILRKYAGGVHANTRMGCLIISNLFLSGVLIVGQRIEKCALLSILSILSLLVIILFAHVDNPNRVLSYIEKKKFRKKAIFISLLEIVISFIGYDLELFKWVQLGMIVGGFMTICGKIKYSNL